MRTLFTFAVVTAMTFSGVALGQTETSTSEEIAVEAVESTIETPTSVVDLGPAPSDSEIDTARAESTATIVDAGIATAVPTYVQPVDQTVWYPEYAATPDCGCQSNAIAPVVYQQPAIKGIVESAGEIAVEGAVETEPVADASSVVESTEPAPVYTDSSVVTETAPMTLEGDAVVSEGTPMVVEGQSVVVEGDPVVSGTPSCGCESAPVMTYSAPAPTAAPCCKPQRRGFFRTLFGL